MYKLEVKLRQHTPLIHFQHDQEGATLRASEVKPKLDRFILSKMTEIQQQEGKKNGWIKSCNGKEALDYKMKLETSIKDIEFYDTNELKLYKEELYGKDKNSQFPPRKVEYGIIAPNSHDYKGVKCYIEDERKKYIAKCRDKDNKIIFDLEQYPCYFGNMDADRFNPDEYKKRSFCYSPIVMTISTKHKECYELLDNDVDYSYFFMHSNFGTRQTKGFGSFYIDRTDEHYKEPSSRYHFKVDIPDGEKDEDRYLFNTIELFYKTLRGGINLKDRNKKTIFYFKSCAFLYCKEVLKSQWDKKSIKSHLFTNELENQQIRYIDCKEKSDFEPLFWISESKSEVDIRDLLGLSTREQWLSYRAQITKEVVGKGNSEGAIERMQSPILFKPIRLVDKYGYAHYKIFIVDNSQYVGLNSLKGHDITISDGHNRLFKLHLPENFTVESFLDYIFNNINLDEYVCEEYQRHKYFKTLKRIYEQISKNMKKQ